ncbi:MAG: PLP-dependent aminotransferase family protein [Clostridiales bacterium]|jgi:DNA-binding transcriptional MocR family regulator|nr:PLP-dependent aminotransferase family protein [Clostridiales bacterium]
MFCTIHLSKSDPTPLYIQLASELAHLIKIGEIPERTKLPTIRTLSRKLKINRDTVVNAYKVLENQGLVVAHVGSGTYVSPLTSQKDYESETNLQTISCSTLSFNKDYFPTSLITQLTEQIIALEGWGAFSDPLYRERNLLRQSICQFFKSVGIMTTPAQIRFPKDFCTFLLDLLKVHPSSTICVEAYHDLTYSSFLRSLGFKIIEIPLTDDGLDLTYLEKQLQTEHIGFIWVSSYVQNPTGISYSPECKKRLIELSHLHHFYIIEDGTLSDFTYSHECLKPLYTLDSHGQVIYLHHFSKLYLPPLQYTFIALPNSLHKKINDPVACTFNERLLHFYLESDALGSIRQEIIEKSYLAYLKVYEALSAASHLLEIYSHKGSLFFWIKPTKISSEAFYDCFLRHHIIISPGEVFTLKSKCTYFRLSLAHLDDHTLPLMIDCLKELSTLEMN